MVLILMVSTLSLFFFNSLSSPKKMVLGDSSYAWNLNTSTDYTYDDSKIEFSGGVAQLKAVGTPGTTWISDEGGVTWKYRRQITIDITGNTTLASGYVVLGSVSGDSAATIYNNSLASGNDFRVVYWDGETTVTDVMRDSVSFTSSSIQFYFKTQAELSANDTTHYFIYYGNASASVPTVDKTQIYNTATNIALSSSGGTASASDAYASTPVTLINDGFADGTHAGMGNNNVANTRSMIKLPLNRQIWKVAQYWGGNDTGGWAKPNGTYFPINFQAQYTADNTALASDVVGDAKWTSLNVATNGLTVVRTSTVDYAPTYPNSPSVSGSTVISGLQSCTNCFGTTISDTFNPVTALSLRFAYTNTAWLGSLGEFYIYPINAIAATAEPTLSFGSQAGIFSTDSPALTPNTGQGYSAVSVFVSTSGSGSTGTIKYQISPDNGATWYWWNGVSWTATLLGYSETSTSTDINTHLADGSFNTLGVSPKTFKWKAYFNSDGSQQPKLDSVDITFVWDTADPDNPAALSASKSQKTDGSDIVSNNWGNHSSPYFTWAEPTDYGGEGESASGIAGYYVYFGTTITGDPHTARGIATDTGSGVHYQTDRDFEVEVDTSAIASGNTYYLRIETKDNAGNIKDLAPEDASLFIYKYDGLAPNSPVYASVSPSGYSRTNSFTFSWPTDGANAATDTGGSSLAGYQYKINNGNWSDTFDAGSKVLADAASAGVNVFYLRAVDVAGNTDQTPIQTNFYFNNAAPTTPINLTVSQPDINENAFSFSWSMPLVYNGSVAGYYYSVNALPTFVNVTYTTSTSLPVGPYATQQGENTLYLVAKDEAGNYDLGSCQSIQNNPTLDSCSKVLFTASTSAPGIPTALQAFDISNRDTREYATTLKWTEPVSKGTGFAGYEIYRSTDGLNFSSVGTTTGTTYADTGITSQLYYYHVKSKDNAGQYSTQSSAVSVTPTGRWTTPPALTEGPIADIKSYSAIISWETDRESSSFVEYGTTETTIGESKGGKTVGKLDSVTTHSLKVEGLQPNIIYYYQAVWVDSDGNQGRGNTLSLQTQARPTISQAVADNITLNSATIKWKSRTIVNAVVNYCKNTQGGTCSIVRDFAGVAVEDHIVQLYDLNDSTEYKFQITGTDTDGNSIVSDEYLFSTLVKPKVTELKFEAIDAPTTTLKFSWVTNVPTTSVVTYQAGGTAVQSQSAAEYLTTHEMTVPNLSDKTTYTLQAKGVDSFGNTCESDVNTFATPDDTRPPKVSELTIEIKSSGFGDTQKAQAIVSWKSDEPGTSQVEYAQGISGTDYNFKTKEDGGLALNHVVIVSDLDPSKIYHLRAVSRDKAGNAGNSEDTTVITGKVQKSVLDIIMNSLQTSLGWLFNIFN